MFFLVVALIFAAEAGTQYAAWRLGFHPNLGPPLLTLGPRAIRVLRAVTVLGVGTAIAMILVPPMRRWAPVLFALGIGAAVASVGPIYAPHRVFVWGAAYAHRPELEPVFRTAWIVTGSTAVALTVVVLRAWHHHGRASLSDSHGSAGWGTGTELHHLVGFLLGRQDRQLLRFVGEGHVFTVAPTRSGKGVSCVIPNLLDYPGSVVVTDPKGENYAVTVRRRGELGQAVHALDPFSVVGGDAAFNPLDLIDPASPDAVDDASLVADMLVLPEGKEGDQMFWNEEARGVLAGLVLHVAASAPPELRSLTHVRTLLTLPPEPFKQLLADMRESSAARGLVARAAARLEQKADRERSGVISTAQSHTHFLDSQRMAHVLARSTFEFASLKREPTSIYLVLPAERFDGYARWLRLMVACGLLAMTRERGQPRHRVLFLLDEFAHLRRMHPVQRDIGLAGGYGVTFWLVVQDLSQLRSTYPDSWPTFLANVDVLQAFGVNDWDTAEYLSKMTGETTIQVASENHSTGVSRGRHPHRQLSAAVTVSETGRRLLTPDEVRRLPRSQQLLFVRGAAPLLADRLDYLADPEFHGRADVNPLYALVDANRAR